MSQHHDASRSKSDQKSSPARLDEHQIQPKILVFGQYVPPTQKGLTKVEHNLDKQRDAIQTCKNLNATLVIQCIATTDAGRKARTNKQSLRQQQEQIEETRGEIAALRERLAASSHPAIVNAGSSTSARGTPLIHKHRASWVPCLILRPMGLLSYAMLIKFSFVEARCSKTTVYGTASFDALTIMLMATIEGRRRDHSPISKAVGLHLLAVCLSDLRCQLVDSLAAIGQSHE